MPVCSASGCPYQPDRFVVHRSTHAFPLNKPALCKQWLRNLGRKDFTPTKTSRLCSAHFEESCFQEDMYAKYLPQELMASNRVRAKKLKPDAVPTLFPHQATTKPREPGERRSEREDTGQQLQSVQPESSPDAETRLQASPDPRRRREAERRVGLRLLRPGPPPAPPVLSYTLVQTTLPPHLTVLYAQRVLREHAYCTPSQQPPPPHAPPAGGGEGEQRHIKDEPEEFCAHQEDDIIAVVVKTEDEEDIKEEASSSWSSSHRIKQERPEDDGDAECPHREDGPPAEPEGASAKEDHRDGDVEARPAATSHPAGETEELPTDLDGS